MLSVSKWRKAAEIKWKAEAPTHDAASTLNPAASSPDHHATTQAQPFSSPVRGKVSTRVMSSNRLAPELLKTVCAGAPLVHVEHALSQHVEPFRTPLAHSGRLFEDISSWH